jgi:hypothetical protein
VSAEQKEMQKEMQKAREWVRRKALGMGRQKAPETVQGMVLRSGTNQHFR